MKFSHSLQFNAVPEWSSKYISYSQLKKLIYALQKEQLYDTKSVDNEAQPLLSGNDVYVSRFVAALDAELRKIDKFYISQETGLMANYEELQDDVRDFEQDLLNNRVDTLSDIVPGRRRSTGSARFSSTSSIDVPDDAMDDIESDQESRASTRPRSHFEDSVEPGIYQSRSRTTNNTWGSSSNAQFISPVMEGKITLKKRIIAIYTQLSELKSYIELNRTGFSKICKKFDKSLQTHIRQSYLDTLDKKTTVFKQQTIETLQNCITSSVVTYARLSQDSFPYPLSSDDDNNSMLDIEMAESQLSSHLREHVVWERNTVWKDMMNLERKAQNVKTENRMAKLAKNMNAKEGISGPAAEVSPGAPVVPTTLADVRKMSWSQWGLLLRNQPTIFKFILITVIFILLLFFSPLQNVLQKNCLAILVYASLLWATETIPLFVTSLLIPMLIVILPVLRDPSTGRPMDALPASQYILSTMWSSVIMLLLGGFTLAAALSKYNIAKVLSTYILSSAGTNPKIILVTNMGVALFVSMWVSNVAAPVLCYSIIQPLLRTLPRNSSYAKSMILGIALASDVGGMASPIASPQNIFSIGLMDPPPSWGEWFVVSLPVCALCVFGIWILLMLTFPLDPSLKLLQLHPLRDPFTLKQWFVTFVSLGTIVLWCFSNSIKGVFGEMGIISIIPLVIFFGTGLLTSDDFNNFMWTIVVLAMGGTTLGKAVTSSGLLTTVASVIKEKIEDKPIFVIVLIFGIVILTTATFVSHTVAAMIIVPLMSEIGANLPSGDHSRLLIMVASLLCSCAMGLPTSGFPNVTAISMIDEVGDRYLSVGTFITRGVPASLICYIVIVTVGYGLMVLVGF
ncbi:PHO91 (YNR013C) [Zygosaccharomyces parabailii]|nr:PHO91 (YNR013C) [Zygosaccharomyces parabailii]